MLASEDASSSIVDRSGRLVADRHVTRVSLSARKRVPFATYEELEASMFKEVVTGRDLKKVLDTKAYPALRTMRWERVLEQCYEDKDGTQFGIALGWFGDAIGQALFRRKPKEHLRPWLGAFERTMKHGTPRDAKAVFGDWLMDELWSLEWTDRGSFERARGDWATRYDIGLKIARRLEKLGARPDAAAAEAVMVIDLISVSTFWEDVVKQMQFQRISRSSPGKA